MAQDIGLDSAAGPSVTLLGANLATGGLSAATATVDFGAPQPLEIGYTLKLDAQASATGYVFLKIAWSHNNTDFSSSDNTETVASVLCTASTIKTKCGSFALRARYAKFYLQNESGGTINSASTSLALVDLFGDQA